MTYKFSAPEQQQEIKSTTNAIQVDHTSSQVGSHIQYYHLCISFLVLWRIQYKGVVNLSSTSNENKMIPSVQTKSMYKDSERASGPETLYLNLWK